MEDPVARALRHMRESSAGGPLPSHLRVTLNFHPDVPTGGATTIELMARDRTYRSQFETGTSNGGLTAHPGGDRWRWESRMFGGAYDAADAALRPKYGALNHRADPVGGGRRFGSCHLRLQPETLARTTFRYPDSHLDPLGVGVAERMGLLELAESDALGLDPLLDDYIEAHVHGPLRLDRDVEAVVLDPCYRGTAVERAALTLGRPVEWHHGFRLSVDRLADCERFRGPVAARAIAAIAVDGAVTPSVIGSARGTVLDHQTAKWAWHRVAGFGGDAGVRPPGVTGAAPCS